MKLKHKLVLLAILVVLIIASQFLFSSSDTALAFYSNNIYYPFQSLRNTVTDYIPFSLGDVLYIIAGIALLITLIRWVYFIINFRIYLSRLGMSFLNTIITLATVILFFIIGWGGNYYKEPLSEYWQLQGKVSRKDDSVALVNFDKFLVAKLNEKSVKYKVLSAKEINDLSVAWYRVYTNCKLKTSGLKIKSTLFGFFMERLGIDGYYNPFTGEGQINNSLPAFELPFLYCHEMAHQAGIAAEEDANLMAYALGTATDDPSFNYSAYLNIWLYTNARLFRRDSTVAKNIEAQLNTLTKAHLDTLETLSKKYNNPAAHISSNLYDSYLKMNHQKEGLRTYGNVASSAYRWEEKKRQNKNLLIKIP